MPQHEFMQQVIARSPVMPVMVINELSQAVPMAQALVAGGIQVFEVTLRTPCALDAIRAIRDAVPDGFVGAGTVCTVENMTQAIKAGAQFCVSPGTTRALFERANDRDIALLPGITTITEVLLGVEHGYQHFKFFPAEVNGGIQALRAFYGPLPDVHFCPTGGINGVNFVDYLRLPNVDCVGGSWLVPNEAVEQQDWQRVTELARSAIGLSQNCR